MGKIVKCRYAYCSRFHESTELPIEEAVQSGKTTYYHADCYKESQSIRNTIDLFQKHINKNVVFAILKKTINNIVYERGIDAEYLEFGLRYYIKNKIPLNYPGGLYYVIQNKDIEKEWNKLKIKQAKPSFEIKDENNSREYDYKPTQENDISSILC